MEKEHLTELKKRLLTLSEEEQMERDAYLRGLVTGQIQGPLVGYPSIDKPALAYYDFEKYMAMANLPKETITRALFRQNKDNQDLIALEYFGSKISYEKFFEKIIALVKAFSNYGIKKGDYVTVCLAGIPEAMAAAYALGYLGAVGIFIPPYLDRMTMIQDIGKDHSKLLIIMDTFYDPHKEHFDDIVANSTIEDIVVVPVLNSSILGKIKRQPKYAEEHIKTYNEFIDEAKRSSLPSMISYEPDMPVAVVYSSGTTGVLKGVLLSHDTVNKSAQSYLSFGFDLSKGQKVYQAIPVWSSTGLIADGTTALYYGCTLHQNPKFDPIVYSKNLGIHRDNWGVATTELFNGLGELSKKSTFRVMLKLGILDYSRLRNIYIGGTLATPKDKAKLNNILKSIGCSAKVNSSYGNCENGSIVTAQLNSINHPDRSVGIPIPGATVMIIDEKGNELPYNERGEITVKTDCGMLRYYNRPDLNGIFFTDETGKTIYKHTGDIGYIMPSGDLIYEGRKNDISEINGTTIYNFDVKNTILADPDVFDCEVFAQDDHLCANIIFYKPEDLDLHSKFRELQAALLAKFNSLAYVPDMFKVWSKFPMASSTKRNYAEIKNQKQGYTYINNQYLVDILKRKNV